MTRRCLGFCAKRPWVDEAPLERLDSRFDTEKEGAHNPRERESATNAEEDAYDGQYPVIWALEAPGTT